MQIERCKEGVKSAADLLLIACGILARALSGFPGSRFPLHSVFVRSFSGTVCGSLPLSVLLCLGMAQSRWMLAFCYGLGGGMTGLMRLAAWPLAAARFYQNRQLTE